jgi:hypothetical protein
VKYYPLFRLFVPSDLPWHSFTDRVMLLRLILSLPFLILYVAELSAAAILINYWNKSVDIAT